MPKLADHAARRAQITDALLRVVATQGLHAVTMRAVAAEAGISLRLVQYYFETKERLLDHAVEHLSGRLAARLTERLRALGPDAPPRRLLETILDSTLPVEDEQRVLHIFYASYAVLRMTTPTLAMTRVLSGPDALEDYMADLFARARDSGHIPPSTEPRLEAAALLAMSGGLGTSVLAGQRTAGDARAVLAGYLDRVFTAR